MLANVARAGVRSAAADGLWDLPQSAVFAAIFKTAGPRVDVLLPVWCRRALDSHPGRTGRAAVTMAITMPTMSIGSAIHWLAEQDPDASCITHENHTCTRAEFDRRTNRLARAFEQFGVKQDDFVTIGLANGIAHYEAAVATWKLGATPQPVSAKLPAAERNAIIELARPALVVGVDPRDVPRGTAALPQGWQPAASISDAPLPERTAKHWKAPTSGGSTGRPKIIVSAQPGSTDPDNPRSRLTQLVPGPLYHNAPFSFSMQSLFAGGHLIVMTRFDAEDALRMMAEHRVQFVVLVPTMMHRIWRLGPEVRARYDLTSLQRILHMAAPCPVWLKEAFIDWLGPDRVDELYAGTEAQGVTTITGPEWLSHRGSVGKAQLGSRDQDPRRRWTRATAARSR